jgi:putative DNA primase/helicase
MNSPKKQAIEQLNKTLINNKYTYTTCPKEANSPVNKDYSVVQVATQGFTNNAPTYTNKLRGEEKLSPDEVSFMVRMNKKFAQIVIGGKHKIVSTKHCPINGMTSTFEDASQFYMYFEHEKKIAGLNPGKAWQQWESKMFYPSGVGFYPNISKCPEDVYNFYSGLASKPVEGDCSVYLNHIKFGICDGDKNAADYIIQWLAHMVQKPDEKPSIAILMKSLEGTGKGLFIKPLLTILGQHGTHVNGHTNLTQRFNSTVANKILIFGDEVDLKDNKVADKLKGLISENVTQLERKGIEPEAMPNYSRFIFASNHVQVINAGLKERRYLVVEPILKDKKYYDAIVDWIDHGGAKHLLYYLMHLDISKFNRNKAPITKALIEEKMCNLPLPMEFIYSEINKIKPFDGKARVFTSELVKGFETWLEDKGKENKTEPSRRTLIGKTMKNLGVKVMGRPDRGQGKYYEIQDYNLIDQFNDFISK